MSHSRLLSSSIFLFVLAFNGCKEEVQDIPIVSTGPVTEVTINSAKANGQVTSDGNSSLLERGIVFDTGSAPTVDKNKLISAGGIGSFSISISSLAPNTEYFVRAFAKNSIGIVYGDEVSFKTKIGLPYVITEPITAITGVSGMSGGNVTDDGGADVTARGICWSTTPSPTIVGSKTADGSGKGLYSSSIPGLQIGTKYYIRAYATNSAGTAYGNEISFTTALFLVGNEVTDIEGTIYKTVIINGNEWMAENLKVGKYDNGDIIPEVTDGTAWAALTTGAFSYYNNDAANNSFLGKLYNWYTVVDNRELCPTGWHVPTQLEWLALITFLGGYEVAGGKVKSIDYWDSPSGPNVGATNESGLTGLPSGFRYDFGNFGSTMNAFWWSSTEAVTPDKAWSPIIFANSAGMGITFADKYFGCSVRCKKD